ncbi:cyclin-dependent kinase inhibitor 3-like [Salvia splendens]|uniref:cyclin-dependent kinase inhibitor 3-like n=1 Tax=Salvia splendens TaxID=180675 RepID=UPI001C25B113|nr:cyclin-dependent kinase inhibitor 3-like [Salvia splendens]
MGKCTKKAKMAPDVALTDVSHSYLGIRTHTKALALFHRLPSAAALKKSMQPQNSRRSYGCRVEEDAEIGRHQEFSPPDSAQGENNLDSDVRQSSTGAITTTKQACSSRMTQNAFVRIAPPAHELEEFFAHEEQLVQRRFVEKYNFDIVKDMALRGRFEWVAVRP